MSMMSKERRRGMIGTRTTMMMMIVGTGLVLLGPESGTTSGRMWMWKGTRERKKDQMTRDTRKIRGAGRDKVKCLQV